MGAFPRPRAQVGAPRAAPGTVGAVGNSRIFPPKPGWKRIPGSGEDLGFSGREKQRKFGIWGVGNGGGGSKERPRGAALIWVEKWEFFT